MIVRRTMIAAMAALLAATLVLAACQARPGDNAYGRNAKPNTLQPYTEDWYKDHGL